MSWGGPDDARLLVSCADRPGIVAAVSRFLFAREANITASDQYSTHPEGGRFFLRMAFHLAGAAPGRAELERAFAEEVGGPFAMDWRLSFGSNVRRIALMVSREEHCLLELLWRWRRGELDAEISGVVSNHPDAEADVRSFGVPFHHIAVTPESRDEAEARALAALGDAELVVLARYMQILSGSFLERLGRPVINIHHSFLPAFPGAGPHERARERGVKLIGATAHYVTEELDDGPIIEQDVVRVDHRRTAGDLARMGRDIERLVLARAVESHLDDRVLVDGRRTVVF